MPPRNRTADRPLTVRQKLFVHEYLIDGNATRAYRAIGYKGKWANIRGYRLLRRPSVRQAVREAQQQTCNRMRLTAEQVLVRLWDESKYHGEGSSPNARVKALELLGKYLGIFQPKPPLEKLLNELGPIGAAALRAALGPRQ